MAGATTGFDRLASQYDELWTRTGIGRLQREAVWRRIDRLFPSGGTILDLGCGTGEDALHFHQRGLQVRAIDASAEMVRIAQGRGIDADQLSIEDLNLLGGRFDGALSNFGALNCVANLGSLRESLQRLIKPGAALAICTIGRACLWESIWYLLHADPRRAVRRWSGASESQSLGIRVHYFSVRELRRALEPDFELESWQGIGLFVPPSFVTGIPRPLLELFAHLDRHMAHWPLLRALADHRLAIFRRK
ncbi:MAG TPA: methyltransferase domain-containing protein [Bryobacteraceae bacterium]|nr:methyltransferase domain-containing protein [Bryobacteraceae bacterium]